jgi:hypothetical protein
MLEHEFYKTQPGRMCYNMHVEQISNAISETLAHGVMVALINHTPAPGKHDLYHQEGSRSKESMRAHFEREKDRWAIAQKTKFGLNLAMADLKKTMQQRKLKANAIVYPAGLFERLPYQDAENIAALSGRQYGQRPTPDALASKAFPGVRLYESRGYTETDHEDPDDPNFREQTIGNYFYMTNGHLSSVKPEHYTTDMMNTFIFSRDGDQWKQIKFREAIRYAGLYHWEEEGMEWTELGQQFFQGERTRNEFGPHQVFHTWGEFCLHTGTLGKIADHIMYWKNTMDKDSSSARKIAEFVRQFDNNLAISTGATAAVRPAAHRTGNSFDVDQGDAIGDAVVEDNQSLSLAPAPAAQGVEEQKAAAQPSTSLSEQIGGVKLRKAPVAPRVQEPTIVDQLRGRLEQRRAGVAGRSGQPQKAAPDLQGDEKALIPADTSALQGSAHFHHRDSHGRFVGNHHHYGRSHFGDDSDFSDRSTYDIEQAFAAAAAASNDIHTKNNYHQLIELVQKMAKREDSEVAQYWLRRFRGREPAQHHLAQTIAAAEKNSAQNDRLFASVMETIQPELLQLDMDASLLWRHEHPEIFGELTPLEQLLFRPSAIPTSADMSEANAHSPSFVVGHVPEGTKRADVPPPQLLFSIHGGETSSISLESYLDSEAYTLCSHYLPLWELDDETVQYFIRHGATLQKFKGESHRSLPANRAAKSCAAFSLQASGVTAHILNEVRKYNERIAERVRTAQARAVAAGSKKPAKGSAAAAAEEKVAEAKEDLAAEHQHLFRDMAAAVLQIVALKPCDDLSHEQYKKGLEAADALNFESLAVQFQLRKIVKHVRALVYRIITDRQPLNASRFALDVKCLFHVIRHVSMHQACQQVSAESVESFRSRGSDDEVVGMDAEYRLGEFFGEFTEAQKAEQHKEATAAVKAVYTTLKAGLPEGSAQEKLAATFCDAGDGGWFDFFTSLHLIVTHTKLANYSPTERQNIFRSFVALFVAIQDAPDAVSYFVTAALEFPLGPTKDWADSVAQDLGINAGHISTLSKGIRAQAEAFVSTAPKSRHVLDNRYIPSVRSEVSEYERISAAAGHTPLAEQDVAIASMGFKPFIITHLHKSESEIRGLINTGHGLEKLHNAIWGPFASHLPNSLRNADKSSVTAALLEATFPGSTGGAALNGSGDRSDHDDQFHAAARQLDMLKIVAILRNTRVSSGDFVRFTLENDCPCPLGIIGFRPHCTFTMGTLIYMVAGGAAGRTWYGHADFQLGNDIQRKMIQGNFTMYAKPVVIMPQNIVLYHNIAVFGYSGGDGHSFYDPNDDVHLQDYIAGHNVRDIFACAVPATHDADKTREMDITGAFYEALCANDEAQKTTEYFSAAAYRDHWQWSRAQIDLNAYGGLSASNQPRSNTLCFQTAQRLYSYNPAAPDAGVVHASHGFGNFTLRVDDCSHWGGNLYNGCTKVCRGSVPLFASAEAALPVTMNMPICV